jgi:hypothetical protein
LSTWQGDADKKIRQLLIDRCHVKTIIAVREVGKYCRKGLLLLIFVKTLALVIAIMLVVYGRLVSNQQK